MSEPVVIIHGSYGTEYRVPTAEAKQWISDYIRQCAPEELLPFARCNQDRADVQAAVNAECEIYNENARKWREVG